MKHEKYTLAELRNKHEPKLTQRGLAEALNMPDSSIAMYENGSRTPSLKRAREIAAFFKVSTDDIIFGKNAHNMRAENTTKIISVSAQ